MKGSATLARVAVALAVPLAVTAPHARAGDVAQSLSNGVEVRVWSPWPTNLNSGWAPAFVEVRNEREQVRRADITARRSEWRLQWRLEMPLELGAREMRSVELLVPMSAEYSNDTNFEVDCDGLRAHLSGAVGASGLAPTAGAVVLYTERKFEPGAIERWNAAVGAQDDADAAGDVAATATTGRRGGSVFVRPTSGDPIPAEIAIVRPEHAPAHTAAYSSLDLVVLDAAGQWPSAERFEALAAWLRVGGDVLVMGPDAARRARANPQLAGWMAPRFELPCNEASGVAYRAALGRLFVAHELLELDGEHAGWVREILAGRSPTTPSSSAWRARGMQALLNLEMVPQRVFAALLLLFALVIGPLNFVVVSRRKRPALLLITIPAISLGVSALLLAFGIFHQGLDVKSASVSVSVLDQRTHVASSIHKRQIFAGMAPAVGLRPTAGTVVHHVALDDESMGPMGAETRLRTSQDRGWTLSGDFLPTRRLASQLLTVDRAERARLEFEFGGAAVQVTNNLGVRVEELLVRDGKGLDFMLNAPLAPGAKGALDAVDEGRAREQELALITRGVLLTPPCELARVVPSAAYLARVGSGALLDECGVATNEQNGLHVVLGVLPAQGEEQR